MNNIDNKLEELKKSKFRNSFHLKYKDKLYIEKKGIEIIKKHAIDFINLKLSPANPLNDGKQTPYHGHPIFVAMHACGCCCRGCLEKWHQIPKGRALNQNEKKYILLLLLFWLKNEYKNIPNIDEKIAK